MKNERQAMIRRIITDRNIETQQELANALQEAGLKVTQATVSRDIKDMRLIKTMSSDGVYKYAIPENNDSSINDRLLRIMKESVLSVDCAGHIIVLKTLSAAASPVCEALDLYKWPEVLGTLAGDNTVMVVVRSTNDTQALTTRIREMLS